MTSIFSKIVAREIPARIVFEDEHLIAFHDIAPQAPVHVVVVPKTEEFSTVTELAAADPSLLAEMVSRAANIAAELSNGDYRLIFNSGECAGQTVFHVHAHVLSGDLAEGSLGGK